MRGQAAQQVRRAPASYRCMPGRAWRKRSFYLQRSRLGVRSSIPSLGSLEFMQLRNSSRHVIEPQVVISNPVYWNSYSPLKQALLAACGQCIILQSAPVAQLDRAIASGAIGREFESLRARQSSSCPSVSCGCCDRPPISSLSRLCPILCPPSRETAASTASSDG
jgi:hypothetical protein